MSQNELIDVVSPHDEVIDRLPRSEVYKRGLLFRVVNVFIRNSQGKIWIPRRHPNKALFPLHLDASAGGHVQSGESYNAAFAREVAEEVSISVSLVPYKMIAKLSPIDHGTSAFMHVYEIYSDDEPDYNSSDFIEAFWLYPAELLAMIQKREKVKSDLPIIVRLVMPLLKRKVVS